MELELDFSEEDVEFADRSQLASLCENILRKVNKLISSYSTGSVLKNGVPVVIAGIPNAGKSSLLNLLLGDEKAIVTDIPGTTRDVIEDTVEIDGILYRFIDTAGIRETEDLVEGIGVGRAFEALDKAFIVIWVLDPTAPLNPQLAELEKFTSSHPSKNLIVLSNKSDISQIPSEEVTGLSFSTHTGVGLSTLLERLHSLSTADQNLESDIIVTNARHFEALTHASSALSRALSSLTGQNGSLPPDLIAQDIREAISHLSTITGSITSTDLLHSIFSRFCIGK